MQTLRAKHLIKTYGEKTLFNNINFIINEHDRIGLIGVNGSGKTSLLNTLDNLDTDSNGEIITSKSYTIGYLKQHPKLDDNLTVLDAVFAGSQDVFNTIRYYEKILDQFSKHPEDEKIQQKYMNAEAQMTEKDAWNAESNVKTILTQLKIKNMSQKVGTLSGGQKRRIGLAQVLIQSPNLLLLDEPTNHLDFDSVDWLQQYLSQYHGALILVTHDRYFLDSVVNNIWELSFGNLYKYTGNYQDYVHQKSERVQEEQANDQKQRKLYKKELAWMHTGVKARGTKQQARVDRFNKLKNNIGNNKSEKNIDINIGQQRLGKKVLQLKHANLSLGDHKILNDFNLLVQGGERIGISGENGAGKTSLLNVIAQKVPLDSGTLTIGETVKVGYYTQQTEPIPGNKRIINYLSDVGESVTNNEGNSISVTQLLEQFLFPRFMHGTLIRKLSGGEKRRLYLLKLLMQKPNVLLLDEPTNDLDIGTLTVLEDYIEHFNGTVVTVSHDRYFLDKVADRLLIFDGNGKIEEHVGKFTDYLSNHEQEERQEKQEKHQNKEIRHQKNDTNQQPTKKKTHLTYAEKIEWNNIEDEIDSLDHQKQDIEKEMASNSDDFNKLNELQNKMNNIDKKSNHKMQRWEYLSQYVDD